ncbi:extracellular solute-binding protein [Paenibacillus sp. R14(2021)]|uniref:extracellular solute-binding protein n=1 Tax=Paenibacillus sp. R14(2021) TaxID=2859228 RepID=UPI001C6149E8|nr:extracellular solute-binding protein [Paenibacillus sp. R14(2021)]
MKKSMNMLLLMSLALTFMLAGCGSSNANKPADTNTGNTVKTNNATQTNANKQEEPAAEEPAPAANELVTIKYATWADPIMEKKRIAAFEAAHPNIKVEIDPSIVWPWDEKLAAAAAADKLPDVSFLFNVPLAVGNGWVEDLTTYLSEDPDYNPDNIYGNLSDTGKYGGKQFALPHGLFAQGIYINLDLFAKENIPVPSANWTLAEFEDISRKLTKFNDHQFGIDGAAGMADVLIPQFDPSLGWGTWDGTKFNFTNAAYADAVNWSVNFGKKDKSSTESYPKAERDKWFGKDKSGWSVGKVGMVFDATWSLAGYKRDLKFKWDFLPLPAVNGQRTPLVTDYAGVMKSSKHKKEAFEFLKWMTYSKDGWMARIRDEAPIASMPLVNDRDVWSAYLSSEHITPGVKEIVKTIPNGFIDSFKWLPGYAEFLAKVRDPYGDKFAKGEARPEDVAAEFQQKSTDIYNAAMAKITEATK